MQVRSFRRKSSATWVEDPWQLCHGGSRDNQGHSGQTDRFEAVKPRCCQNSLSITCDSVLGPRRT